MGFPRWVPRREWARSSWGIARAGSPVASPLPIRACHRSDEGRTNGVDEEDHYHNSIGRLQVPYSARPAWRSAALAALRAARAHTAACSDHEPYRGLSVR
jgi:hypothetical protein